MTITQAIVWYIVGAFILSIATAYEQSHRTVKDKPYKAIVNGLFWPLLPPFLLILGWLTLIDLIQKRGGK